LRAVAALRIADDKAIGTERDFRVEALRIVPIDADQEVEAIRVALDRMRREAEEGGGFATADLRADRAGEKTVPAGRARRFEQHGAGGQYACAAAPHKGNRNVGTRHESIPL
jgi:hypothetical protein